MIKSEVSIKQRFEITKDIFRNNSTALSAAWHLESSTNKTDERSWCVGLVILLVELIGVSFECFASKIKIIQPASGTAILDSLLENGLHRQLA